VPKKVDHQERRRLIADALMRVAADRGLEAVSLRHVAAEGGVSAGRVQHYFHTKDEMMLFALHVVSENVQARMVADGVAPSGPGGLVRALLAQMLPLDDARRNEGRAALAFIAHAAVSPPVAAVLRENITQMRTFLADQIRQAQATGEAPGHLDPDHTATALLALMDGLGVQVLAGHYPPEHALAVFDAQLAALFGRPAAT
jgi:AcrR family transcriptional regulator